MAQDVREYFKVCPADNRRLANYTATQLARGGIDDMDILCELAEKQPEKILNIRNIGPKSMCIIRSVCTIYHKERHNDG